MGKKHIVFTGGGTAGHISPLLAVLEEVQRQDPAVQCSYIGLTSDLESPLIKNSPLIFKKYAVPAGKLNRHLTLKNLTQPFLVSAGFLQAHSLLKKLKPTIVFSKGGYVSIPVALAAAQLNIPILSHETDVIPGLANRIIGRYAKTIFTAFPIKAYRALPAEKLVYTGQPVRDIFRQPVGGELIIDQRPISFERPLVTIIGGSQGAHRLNEFVHRSWEALLPETQIVHLCGTMDYAWLHKEAAGKEGLWVVPFIGEELAALFQRSAVVVSRAGGTMAELAATKTATILVPLSTASQDHQRANANVLAHAHAALVVDEIHSNEKELLKLIQHLLKNVDERNALQQAIATFDHPNAARLMAEKLLLD